MKLLNYLNELFDKPVPYVIKRQMSDDFQAKFIIDNNEYVFEAFKEDYDTNDLDPWLVQFAIYEKLITTQVRNFAISGTGNEIKVFATVIDIFKKFISLYNPRQFKFSSQLNEPSRTKLYDRFFQLIPKYFPKYKGTTERDYGEKIYYLVLKGYNN